MLKENLGATAFKENGFGIYSTSGTAAICAKMATAFEPTPPTDVRFWDFTDLPPFKWDDTRGCQALRCPRSQSGQRSRSVGLYLRLS